MLLANTAVVVLLISIAVVLLLFLVIKNRRDRKKLFKPGLTDPLEDVKMENERRKDQV